MSYGDHLRHGANEGMGGYLDPPGYPTHTYSVGSGRKNNPHSLMSLETAITAEEIKPTIREQARKLIADWHAHKPALDSGEVQTWIQDCQRHWAGCWYAEVPDGYGCHCASPHYRHGHAVKPEEAVDYAIYHIQRFYPEFKG